ncbi:MAG: hypothetical protein LBJ35_06250 [Spirochaetaceae bacterium]|jgi:hypothetical protein|nr:hypothetical protein [Spirochaetaceae bacterium]
MWYAGGGAGSAEAALNDGEEYGAKSGKDDAAGTGAGGSGSGGAYDSAGKYIIVGGNGGSGIVIVRWEFAKDE